MSLRREVDAGRIRLFLERLGERFRHPATVYLVGGTTVVLEGHRLSTLDIDVAFEVAGEHHGELVEALRALMQELGLNVEEASPGHFIPLPSGYRDRHQHVGRFGQLETYHFDLYSTALSKIERGTEKDLADVLTLLRAQRIQMRRLVEAFDDIRPRLAGWSVRLDPQEFAAKFELLRRRWEAEASPP